MSLHYINTSINATQSIQTNTKLRTLYSSMATFLTGDFVIDQITYRWMKQFSVEKIGAFWSILIFYTGFMPQEIDCHTTFTVVRGWQHVLSSGLFCLKEPNWSIYTICVLILEHFLLFVCSHWSHGNCCAQTGAFSSCARSTSLLLSCLGISSLLTSCSGQYVRLTSITYVIAWLLVPYVLAHGLEPPLGLEPRSFGLEIQCLIRLDHRGFIQFNIPTRNWTWTVGFEDRCDSVSLLGQFLNFLKPQLGIEPRR